MALRLMGGQLQSLHEGSADACQRLVLPQASRTLHSCTLVP